MTRGPADRRALGAFGRARGEGSPVAVVLGGGGGIGASQVGMLAALREAGIRPDLVVGTSIGAINGAMFAADPTAEGIRRLREAWLAIAEGGILGGSLRGRAANLVRSGTGLLDPEPLRALLGEHLPVESFEELAVPFQCVAASVERGGARWFDSGSLVEALLASSAAVGAFPPHRYAGEHHLDGGLVHPIPVGRAVELGARTLYVCHVGVVDGPLRPPRRPWQVPLVALEITRRHRYVEEIGALPDGVVAHVLPTGGAERLRLTDPAQLRELDSRSVRERIDRAERAARARLDGLSKG